MLKSCLLANETIKCIAINNSIAENGIKPRGI
jgi:hypothetical protein